MKRKVEQDHGQVRAVAYPGLAEFADAFYWNERGNPEPMRVYLEKIDAVKAQYPKRSTRGK